MVSRFFQLLSGHAAIGPYVKEKTGTIQSDECWWCGSVSCATTSFRGAELGPDQGAVEKRWEGMRVEAPTSANRQTVLPG